MKILNKSLNIKKLALILIVFLPLVVSCNKEKDIIKTGSNGFSVLQVSFDSLDVVTKTQHTFVNKKLKTTWKEGDEIAFTWGSEIYRFVQNGSITDEGHSTLFICDKVVPRFYGTAVALYPYKADLSFSIEEQTGTIEDLSKIDILIAQASFSESITLKFSPLCAILRFPKGMSVGTEWENGETKLELRGENVANYFYYDKNRHDIVWNGSNYIIITTSVTEGKLLEDLYVAFYPKHKEGEYLYTLSCGLYENQFYKNGISTSKIYSINPSSIGFVDFGTDSNFKRYCIEHFDKNGDGKISFAEAKLVSKIDLTDESSLQGIEHFKNLTELKCHPSGETIYLKNNPKLTSLSIVGGDITQLDLSNNTCLEYVLCSGNLTQLDLSNNPELTTLRCSNNSLSHLDVSNNTKLSELYCMKNNLTQLDLSNNPELTTLRCSNNSLSHIDVSNNTKLSELDCGNNNLTQLDLSNNPELKDLKCPNNSLSHLDVSNNTKLSELDCGNNNLTQLDLSNNPELKDLKCPNNSLSHLDVSNNTKLSELDCGNNNLTQLDLSNNFLVELYCPNNSLSQLDVGKHTNLSELDCFRNNLTCLDLSNNTKLRILDCGNNNLTQLDLKKNTKLQILKCNYNQLTSLDISNCSNNFYLMAWAQRGTLSQLFLRKEHLNGGINFFFSSEDRSESYSIYPPDSGTEIITVD